MKNPYFNHCNLPAPLAVIELSVCGYRTGCKTNCCKCRKNGFTCTDMCKYAQCENNDCWIEDKHIVVEEEADMKISSYFFMLKFCCDYFIAKGYYLTIILFHIIMALCFKIFKGSEIVISSILFRENFR